MTPEGKVKAKVKKLLAEHGDMVYSHWPVLNGMGAAELDCNVVAYGTAITIETKAPGEKPTGRQRQIAKRKRAAGAIVLYVSDGYDMDLLKCLLGDLKRWYDSEHGFYNHQARVLRYRGAALDYNQRRYEHV